MDTPNDLSDYSSINSYLFYTQRSTILTPIELQNFQYKLYDSHIEKIVTVDESTSVTGKNRKNGMRDLQLDYSERIGNGYQLRKQKIQFVVKFNCFDTIR